MYAWTIPFTVVIIIPMIFYCLSMAYSGARGAFPLSFNKSEDDRCITHCLWWRTTTFFGIGPTKVIFTLGDDDSEDDTRRYNNIRVVEEEDDDDEEGDEEEKEPLEFLRREPLP